MIQMQARLTSLLPPYKKRSQKPFPEILRNDRRVYLCQYDLHRDIVRSFFLYYRISFLISPAVSAIYEGLNSSSSVRGRKPHVTPQAVTPALAAVCISTPESPTYSTSSLATLATSRISDTIIGSGLTLTSSRCPSTAVK